MEKNVNFHITFSPKKAKKVKKSSCLDLARIAGIFRTTLRLKSLWPLGSVWGKTILNTGSVGGAGADPQT